MIMYWTTNKTMKTGAGAPKGEEIPFAILVILS